MVSLPYILWDRLFPSLLIMHACYSGSGGHMATTSAGLSFSHSLQAGKGCTYRRTPARTLDTPGPFHIFS